MLQTFKVLHSGPVYSEAGERQARLETQFFIDGFFRSERASERAKPSRAAVEAEEGKVEGGQTAQVKVGLLHVCVSLLRRFPIHSLYHT